MPGWAPGAPPTPLTHSWVSTTWGNPLLLHGQTPLALAPWLSQEASRGKFSPFCNQEPEERTEGGEGHCYKERSPQIRVGRAGTQQVPDVPSARCSAPSPAASTTGLLVPPHYFDLFHSYLNLSYKHGYLQFKNVHSTSSSTLKIYNYEQFVKTFYCIFLSRFPRCCNGAIHCSGCSPQMTFACHKMVYN